MRWSSHERELRQRLGMQLQETQRSDRLTVYETVLLDPGVGIDPLA